MYISMGRHGALLNCIQSFSRLLQTIFLLQIQGYLFSIGFIKDIKAIKPPLSLIKEINSDLK